MLKDIEINGQDLTRAEIEKILSVKIQPSSDKEVRTELFGIPVLKIKHKELEMQHYLKPNDLANEEASFDLMPEQR